MSFFELLLIAVGLSMDCFAVAICIAMAGKPGWKDVIRLAFFFALFQGGFPIIGWTIGDGLQHYIAAVDHWIAFAILAFIGGRMIVHSYHPETQKQFINIGKISVVITLSIATSIDSLVTGVSFGFIQVNIWVAALLIFIITFLNTLIAVRLGTKTRIIPVSWAERLGGVVIIAIGCKVVFDHLTSLS